jgi:hypothetical protein
MREKRSLLVLALLAIALSAKAALIMIPDVDFSTSATSPNTLTSVISPASQIAVLAGTPWASQLTTPAGIGLTVSANITGGQAVISTPLEIGVGSTSGLIYQNLNQPFQIGTYTLTTTITSATPLSLALLTNSGVGVGLVNNSVSSGSGLTLGTQVSNSITNSSALSLSLLSGDTYSLTFTFNDTSVTGGSLGVELFSGNSSVLSTGLLSGASFGPVSLSVTPEPNCGWVVCVGAIAAIILRYRANKGRLDGLAHGKLPAQTGRDS